VSAAPLVQARGLGKRYPRVTHPRDRLRALARLVLGRDMPDATEVLADVSLEVRAGESLAVIGENGAGKSTLLKLLTGVLAPSSGVVQVNGSVAALLELGAGFHPEYTGRENLALSSALLGFAPGELRSRIDDILAFADIGRYVDEPIKHYSSGMIVRLGFALVAARRPDLLITDEVLAVGDEAFQRKCVAWIEDYLSGGGTLLLVSHSMYHVRKLCRRALWLHHGRVQAYGDVHDVSQQYLAHEERRIAAEGRRPEAIGTGLEFGVVELRVEGDASELPCARGQGEPLRIEADVHSRDGRVPHLAIGLTRADGTAIYGTSSEMAGATPDRLDAHRFRFRLEFDALALLPGSYLVRAHAMDSEALRLFDTVERQLVVRGESREFGLVRLAHRWSGGGPATVSGGIA